MFNMDSPHKSFSTQRKTVTQTVVQQHAGNVSNTSSLGRIAHLLEEEPWERSPKTDYTYSHSVSYYSRGQEDGLPSPNLSRPRLRAKTTFLEIPRPSPSVPSITVSEVEKSRETNVSQSRFSKTTEEPNRENARRNLLSASFSGESHNSMSSASSRESRKSVNRSVRRSMPRMRSPVGLPPSATRAGTQYGVDWEPSEGSASPSRRKGHRKSTDGSFLENNRRSTRSAVVVHESVDYDEDAQADESDVASGAEEEESVYTHSFSYTEPSSYDRYSGKLYEQAEPTVSYRESSLDHLYGLDQTDDEYSDKEVSFPRHRRRRRSGSQEQEEEGVISTVVTTTVTVITTFFALFGKCLGLMKSLVDVGYGAVRRRTQQRNEEFYGEESHQQSDRRRSRRLQEKKTSLAADSEADSDYEEEEEDESSVFSRIFSSIWSFLCALLMFPLALVRKLGNGSAGALAWVWAHMFSAAASEQLDHDTGSHGYSTGWQEDSQTSTVTKTTTHRTDYSSSGGRHLVGSAEMSDNDDDDDLDGGHAARLGSWAVSGGEQRGFLASFCSGLLGILLAPWALLKWLSCLLSNILSWLFHSTDESDGIHESEHDSYDASTSKSKISEYNVLSTGPGPVEVSSTQGSAAGSEHVESEFESAALLSTGTGPTPVKGPKRRRHERKKTSMYEKKEFRVVESEPDSSSDGLCTRLLKTLGSWLLAVLVFPFALLKWIWSGITYYISTGWNAIFGSGESESLASSMARKTGSALKMLVLSPFALLWWIWSGITYPVSTGWSAMFGHGESESLASSMARKTGSALKSFVLAPFALLRWIWSGITYYVSMGWNAMFGHGENESLASSTGRKTGSALKTIVLSPFALLKWIWSGITYYISMGWNALFGSGESESLASSMARKTGSALKTLVLSPFAGLCWLFGMLWHMLNAILLSPLGGLLGRGSHGLAEVHRGLAKTALTDVWLLSRTSYYRRRHACCCLLPILLIPLFLTILYYLWDQQLVEDWYGAGTNSLYPPGAVLTSTMSSIGSLFAVGSGKTTTTSQAQVPLVLVGNETNKELQEKIQVILIGLLKEQEQKQQQQVLAERTAWERQQTTIFGAYRNELEELVKAIVARELAIFAARMDSQNEDTRRQAKEAVAAAILTDDQLSSKVQSLLVLLLEKHDEHQQAIWLQKQDEWQQEQQTVLNTYQSDMSVLVNTLAQKEVAQAAAAAVEVAAKEAASVAVGAAVKEESEKQRASAVVVEKDTPEVVTQAGVLLDDEALSAKVSDIMAALLQQQESNLKQQSDALVLGWVESRDRDQAALVAKLNDQVKEVVEQEAAVLIAKLETEKAAMLAAIAVAGRDAVTAAQTDANDEVAAAAAIAVTSIKEAEEAAAAKISSKDSVGSPGVDVGAGVGVGVGVTLTESDIKEQVQTTTVLLLQQHQEKADKEWLEKQKMWEEAQMAAFADYKSGVSGMVAKAIEAQVQQQVSVAFLAAQGETAAVHEKLTSKQEEQAGLIAALQTQLQDIMAKSENLATELDAARAEMKLQSAGDPEAHDASVLKVQALEAQLANLKDDMGKLQAAQAAFALQLKDCCKNDTALAALIAAGIQRHMGAMMDGGSGDTAGAGAGAGGATFVDWLQSQFVKRDDIDGRVSVLTAKIQEEMKNDAVAAAIAAMATREASSHTETRSTVNIDMGGATGMTDERVKHLIREALLIFAADKTGQVDYALESAGGSVISTRCSETYHRHTAQLSLFGIPLWYASNSPRTVIQPDIYPGQCWAFRGQQGFLVIHLTGRVQPTSFSLEHIPKSLSPTGRIDSAPKDFSVLGLVDEQDAQGKVLGNYTYTEEGDPLQFFIVKDPEPGDFTIIELRIMNNHGNEEYTCLYRFRVHGIPKI